MMHYATSPVVPKQISGRRLKISFVFLRRHTQLGTHKASSKNYFNTIWKTEIFKSIDWSKVIPLVIAQDKVQLAREVNNTLNIRVTSQNRFSQIDMKAADRATIGILHDRAKWTESPSDARGYDIMWSFSP